MTWVLLLHVIERSEPHTVFPRGFFVRMEAWGLILQPCLCCHLTPWTVLLHEEHSYVCMAFLHTAYHLFSFICPKYSWYKTVAWSRFFWGFRGWVMQVFTVEFAELHGLGEYFPWDCPHFWHQLQVQGIPQDTLRLDTFLEGTTVLLSQTQVHSPTYRKPVY